MEVLQNQNVIILVLFDDDYDDHLEGDDDDYEYDDDDDDYEYDDHHEGGDLLQLRVIEALQGTMDKTNLGQGSQPALCKVMMVMMKTKMMTMMTKILMMITMMMILWTIIPL